MPHLFTLPGPRDGTDNVFAMHSLALNEVRTIAAGTKVYSSLQTLYWADYSHGSVINSGRIWGEALDRGPPLGCRAARAGQSATGFALGTV